MVRFPGLVRFFAAAAALVVLAAIVWRVFEAMPGEDTFPRFRERMARSVQRTGSTYMNFVSTNQAEIREFFRGRGATVDYEISTNLQQLPGEGGSVLTWNTHPVEMLCLNGGVDTNGVKYDLWVFIMKKDAVPDAPPAGKASFELVGTLMTASWSAGDKLYVLAGRGGEEDLQKFLQ